MFNLKPEDKIGKVIKEIQNEENNGAVFYILAKLTEILQKSN